mgnify:CR=1 FL=1
MHAKIQKWGNSLALRIPKALADETGLQNDSLVELKVVEGQIHIVLAVKARYELDALLSGVTTDNVHGEMDTGNTLGSEVW